MQSHVMTKRRSEVGVASLRPLALNRATSEILPSRGTLFLKGESTESATTTLTLCCFVKILKMRCLFFGRVLERRTATVPAQRGQERGG